MKKVIIIGAGIAGLTCGVYAAKNGFETEIYELHSIPGGECTGWDRKGYHFDGCIHWLVGSKQGTDLNGLWHEIGALNDSVHIIDHNVFAHYEEDGKAVNLYTNADALEKHFIQIAPEDKSEIKKLCRALRSLGSFGMPLDKPMDMMTMKDGLKFAAKNIRGITKMAGYRNMSMKQLAERFKSGLLRRALLSSFAEEYTSMALITTLAGMNWGDSGYPEGGSRAFAKRIEQKFLELGGKVHYKSAVDKIIVEGNAAKGIRLADGNEVFADHIVSCADGYYTLKHMLDDKYTPESYDKLFSKPKEYLCPTSSIVFFGVDAKLPYDYRSIISKRDEPKNISGVESEYISMLNYGYDKSMAPEGKSVIACFYGADYDWWNEQHKDPAKYEAAKLSLEEDAKEALLARYPETEGRIEAVDVVTPMTYQRYCNAWRGSWMTWVNTGKDIPQYHPGVFPGLENFIMAGMWTLPPGGLPGASASGKFAAQRLCLQEGIPFKSN